MVERGAGIGGGGGRAQGDPLRRDPRGDVVRDEDHQHVQLRSGLQPPPQRGFEPGRCGGGGLRAELRVDSVGSVAAGVQMVSA